MAYRPGVAHFRFAGDAYLPPAHLLFNFGGSQEVIPAPPPSLILGMTASWSRPATKADTATASAWGTAPAKEVARGSAWSKAHAVDDGLQSRWSAVDVKDTGTHHAWGTASGVDGAAASAWGDLPAKDTGIRDGWDQSIRPADWKVQIAYDPAVPTKDSTVTPLYQRSNEYGTRIPQSQPAPLHFPSGAVAFWFQGALYSPPAQSEVFFHFYVTPIRRGRIGPVDSVTALRWSFSRQLDLFRRIPWGRARPLDPVPTGIEYPDYEGPITIIVPPPAEPDILETYMIANSVSLVALPDRTPLDATGMRVSRDLDSWAWTLSATLFGRTSLALVRPDASGPKEVELTINGHTWLFLIERYTGTGKLADERYSITGVSRTQLLAEPYAPKRSQANSAPVNASWAVGSELENTGFTSEWSIGIPDWTLPTGAMSYQDKTPMQVIAQLAEAAGGVVRPALASNEITILPRYREPVWQWSSAIMDRIIPAQVVSEWGSEWQPQPQWNSCYVSGTNHGVSVNVRRAGTAGDQPAPDVYDDWITDTQPARSRGIAEISKGGNQEIVTLNLPLFPAETAPGLAEPGMLCEVRDVDETWRGLCLATEISAEGIGASRVKQTLKLERHHREGA